MALTLELTDGCGITEEALHDGIPDGYRRSLRALQGVRVVTELMAFLAQHRKQAAGLAKAQHSKRWKWTCPSEAAGCNDRAQPYHLSLVPIIGNLEPHGETNERQYQRHHTDDFLRAFPHG